MVRYNLVTRCPSTKYDIGWVTTIIVGKLLTEDPLSKNTSDKRKPLLKDIPRQSFTILSHTLQLQPFLLSNLTKIEWRQIKKTTHKIVILYPKKRDSLVAKKNS